MSDYDLLAISAIFSALACYVVGRSHGAAAARRRLPVLVRAALSALRDLPAEDQFAVLTYINRKGYADEERP
jgi:hypothetical protein